MTHDEKMYLNFFQLSEEPFNNTPDPRFLYLSRQHEEALESLLYGIHHRKGFMAVVGAIGTGKTTLCRALLERLDKNIDTSIILNPMLSVLELLTAINDDFGNMKGRDDTVKGQIDALNEFMVRRLRWQKNAVVIIDEAQHLSFETFEMLRMLSNLETEDKKLLQIIFVGQPELQDKLNSPSLRQLNQRIAIRYLLGSLNFAEMQQYVAHRLAVAGKDTQIRFEQKAIKRIYQKSQGVPRVINTICDRSLLDAFGDRKTVITKRMVKHVVSDIDGTFNLSGVEALKKGRASLWKRIFSS